MAASPNMDGMALLITQIIKTGIITRVGSLTSEKKIKPDASLTPTPPKIEGSTDLKKKIQPIPRSKILADASGRNRSSNRKN